MAKKTVKKPAAWLYLPLRALSALVCRVIFRLKITGGEDIPREGPLLILSSHQGMIDFLILLAAFPHRRIHFVATERQFRNPKLHWAYKRLGLIPKIQFRADPRCTMGILRVLRAGGTVGIFPAGQTSMCGIPTGIDPVIARLVKKSAVPVCTVCLHGGFLTFPRFAKWFTRGRTEAHLELAFTPQQLETLSEEEIFSGLLRRIDYDEYDWQSRVGARFPGKKRAAGMDKVLYLCPVCSARGKILAEGNSIRCLSCGARGEVTEEMRVSSPESAPFPPTMKEWYLLQERELSAAFRQPGHRLEARVRCQLFDPARFVWNDEGEGVLSLLREEIRYDGGFSGETVSLSVPHEALPGCAGAPSEYIELYHEGKGLLRYRPVDPQDGWLLAAVKIGQELLHREGKAASAGI